MANKCFNTSGWAQCRPWDLTEENRTNQYANAIQQESLEIAGAKINVHKLLGIDEKTKLTDATGQGTAISSGYIDTFKAENAFSAFDTIWKSKQAGGNVTQSGWIGYDFGVQKLASGRERYVKPIPVVRTISTIKIKQSFQPNRVLVARVERSDDRVTWRGVDIITIPDTDALSTVSFLKTVPSRYWRLVPLQFSGGPCDNWIVDALELCEYVDPNILGNVQDSILLENRDRSYNTTATLLRGFYSAVSPMTELLGLGQTWSDSYIIKVNFSACVAKLGRPIVVGDIIELPSETQYTTSMTAVKRYLEVIDVGWDAESYTPGWMPTMLSITAKKALASQETKDLFPLKTKQYMQKSDVFNNDGIIQDSVTPTQTIEAESIQNVPMRGSEGSNVVRQFTDAEILAAAPFTNLNKQQFNNTALFVEDALPQNGEIYTEGPVLPDGPTGGEYHRLIYQGSAKNIPARLYRWSSVKARWIYIETDKRSLYDSNHPILQEYIKSVTGIPSRDIK